MVFWVVKLEAAWPS